MQVLLGKPLVPSQVTVSFGGTGISPSPQWGFAWGGRLPAGMRCHSSTREGGELPADTNSCLLCFLDAAKKGKGKD